MDIRLQDDQEWAGHAPNCTRKFATSVMTKSLIKGNIIVPKPTLPFCNMVSSLSSAESLKACHVEPKTGPSERSTGDFGGARVETTLSQLKVEPPAH